MKTVIVIPARYGSTRFPGKPLAKLGEYTILERVWRIAQSVCRQCPDCSAIVATEEPKPDDPENSSEHIITFCEQKGIHVAITPSSCRSGSDRCLAVFDPLRLKSTADSENGILPDVVINMQGDNPLCPPSFVKSIIDSFAQYSSTQVATPFVQLTWEALDAFRAAKQQTPFSGTTVTIAPDGNALWFSKNLIPAIRTEKKLREGRENSQGGNLSQGGDLSPVCRHIGLYGYRYATLQKFSTLPQSRYEQLEQLEQLRFLENGIPVRMVEVRYPEGYETMTSGIDTPEDLVRAEELIKTYGELNL